MKRVIIVPASEIKSFPGLTVIARGGAIAALIGDSFVERSRKSFGSEEEFFDGIALGRADMNTFATEEDAAAFASAKIDALNAEARRVEEAISRMVPTLARKPPQVDERVVRPRRLVGLSMRG